MVNFRSTFLIFLSFIKYFYNLACFNESLNKTMKVYNVPTLLSILIKSKCSCVCVCETLENIMWKM